METLSIIISLVSVVAGVLQIILFFKVWRMCNDIKAMRQVQAPLPEQSTEEKNNANETREGCALAAFLIVVCVIVCLVVLNQ